MKGKDSGEWCRIVFVKNNTILQEYMEKKISKQIPWCIVMKNTIRFDDWDTENINLNPETPEFPTTLYIGNLNRDSKKELTQLLNTFDTTEFLAYMFWEKWIKSFSIKFTF